MNIRLITNAPTCINRLLQFVRVYICMGIFLFECVYLRVYLSVIQPKKQTVNLYSNNNIFSFTFTPL